MSSYRQEYEERKKKKVSQSGTTSNVISYREQYYQRHPEALQKAGEDIGSRVTALLKNYNTYVNDSVKRYEGRKNNYEDAYVSDAGAWYDSVVGQNINISKEIDSVLSDVNRYGDYFDSNWVKEVTEGLSSMKTNSQKILDTASSDKDYWASFGSEEHYIEQQGLSNEYQASLDYDLEAGLSEIELMETILNLKRSPEESSSGHIYIEDFLDEGTNQNSDGAVPLPATNLKKNQFEYENKNTPTKHLLENSEYWDMSREELEALISSKKQYHNIASRAQQAEELASVADINSNNYDIDFDKYAEQGEQRTDNYISELWNDESFKEHKDRMLNKKGVTGTDDGYRFSVLLSGHTIEEYEAALFMKDNEFEVYNYYFEKDKIEGTSKAKEYLNIIRERIEYREGENTAKWYKDKPVLELAFGVSAGMGQFTAGMMNLFSNEEYIPASSTEIASKLIREDLGDDGFKLPKWLGGASIGQVGYDVITTTSNMLPSILVSQIPGVGQVAGPVVLGASAAGNAKAEMLRMGYDKNQATTYGIMVGVSEAVLEKFLGAIPGLSKGSGVFSTLATKAVSKVDNVLAKVAILIGSGLDEALEEGLQTVIEPWLAEAATHVDFESANAEEVLYSSLLGFLSAFGLEGTITTFNGALNAYNKYIATNEHGQRIINKGGVDKLLSSANQFANDKKISKLTSKVEKKASARNVGKLSMAVEKATSAKTTAEAVAELRNLGLTDKEAKAVVDFAEKVSQGYEPTKAETARIEAITDKLPDVLDVESAESSQASTKHAKAIAMSESSSETLNASQSENRAAVAAVNDERGGVSGTETNALAVASKKYGKHAETMKNMYLPTQSAEEYDIAFMAAYDMGRAGVPFAYVETSEATSHLTAAQRKAAYGIGKAVENKSNAQDSDVVDNAENKGYNINDLNDSEINAIMAYKSGGSYTLNAKLREGVELNESEQEIVNSLDKALEKLPTYKGKVYRNIQFDGFGDSEARDAYIAKHIIGDIVPPYNAYTSASTESDGYVLEGDYVVRHIIQSADGRNLAGYGNNFESEVLFSRTTYFVTDKIEYDADGTPTIYLTEVSNGQEAENGGRGDKETLSVDSRGQQKESRISKGDGAVQQLSTQNIGDSEVQASVPEWNTSRGIKQGELQKVRTEVNSGNVVYSSKKAMATDAISPDKLSDKQRHVVRVAEQIGRKVIFATTTNKNGVEVDGFLGKDGVIYINSNNRAPMAFVFKHELTHFCEKAGQKYRDFVNAVRFSATFKKWLKDKGFGSELEYNASIRNERAEIGETLDEESATREIIANFVGEMMFGDNQTISENLISELTPKQRKTISDYIRDFIAWLKAKFTGNAAYAKTEVQRLEDKFAEAYKAALKNQQSLQREQYAKVSKKDPTKLDPRTVTREDVREMLTEAKREDSIYYDNTYIPLRINTPFVLIQSAKEKRGDVIDNNPIAISAGKAYQAMSEKTRNNKDRPHKLSVDDMLSIIEAMDDPLYVVYQGINGRYVMVVEYETIEKKKAFAVMEIGENKDSVYMNGYEGGLYNILVTTYPPDSGKLRELLENRNNDVVYNKKKGNSQRTSGSMVPSVLNDSPFFIDSIPENEQNSNSKNAQNLNVESEQFAFNNSFGQQLKDWEEGNGKANRSYNGKFFRLGTTPEVLIRHGAPEGEVIMYEDCLLKITGLKHTISLDELAKIPSQLNDPILLFKGSVENSFVALTEIKAKNGHDVIVAVHIGKRMGRSVINKITSVYSKTDDFGNNRINNYVTEQIRKGNLIDASITKAPNWFTASGLQLPHAVQTILDANNSISHSTEKSTKNSKKVSDGETEQFSYTPKRRKIAQYIPYDKVGKENIRYIKKKLNDLYGNVDNGVANGIAVEKDTTVYIVDSGKENGEITFGVRKRFTITDNERRINYVRRINNESRQKGYISDGLSSRIGDGLHNDWGSHLRREFREELQTDNGESQNNEARIFGDNGDRGGVNSRFSLDDSASEQFSYASVDPDEWLDRYEKGEITREQYLEGIQKKQGDTPTSIANLKPKDMNTTPPLPKRTGEAKGDGESSFYSSLKGSSIFDERFKEEVKNDNFIKNYQTITNKETLAEAAKLLDEGGQKYVTEWDQKSAKNMTTVDTVAGFILMKRYQDIGDYEGAAKVAQKIREVGTLAGQTVQAFSIIGRFDADTMQAYAQRDLDSAWEEAVKGRSQKWIDKHREQFKLTDTEIAFIRDNILYASKLPDNSREKAIALAEITTLLQNKLPPVKGQSFKAWQRISMLLNPKTQIRNILGNAVMVPAFVASDWFSTPLDKVLSRKTGVRTTGLTGTHGNLENIKSMGRGLFESYDDWKRHINTRQHDLNRFEIGQGKSFDETRWGRIAKIMNVADRFTSFLLDAGDRTFYEMWFVNSLNNQLRLNKVTEPTEAMVEIAIDEALERTWQDDNVMTKMVAAFKRGGNYLNFENIGELKKISKKEGGKLKESGYGLGDVLVKFSKTPANLTKAIYNFSPAAIVTLSFQAVTLTKAIRNGTVTPDMQKRFVNNFGKMAAGTMLYVIFALLYNAGRISGASDEDKDVAAFEKYIQGIPEYSIKIGNKWFSFDWAQPIGAVPAIVADFMESKEEGNTAIDSVTNAFEAGGEVLFNQSFMTSFQTLFAADSFAAGFLDITLGEVTVPIPTLFSQVANVFDDKRRVTYDGTSEWKSALNRAISKFPGLRNLLVEDVDIFGREIDNSQQNWFNAFFNPANVYTDTSNEISDHVYEIYKSTGDVGSIPAKAPYSVELQGVKKKLNDAERADYQRTMGQAASEMIEALLENDAYLAMNDQEKLSVLKSVYSYSATMAKSELDWYDSYEVIHGIAEHITESDFDKMSEEDRIKIVEDYLLSDFSGIQDIETDNGKVNYLINKKTASLVLSATKNNDIKKAKEYLGGIEKRVDSYGWNKSDTTAEIKDTKTVVKTALTRYWKATYLYAYYKGRRVDMNKIYEMLVELGLYGGRFEVRKKLKEWLEEDEEN